MPSPRKMYIERKTKDGKFLGHRGPAIIGEVTFSKTGRTIYYRGFVFKRPSSNEAGCIYGNYYNYDPSCEGVPEVYVAPDEFWISGVKKRGSNRMAGFESHPVIEDGDL